MSHITKKLKRPKQTCEIQKTQPCKQPSQIKQLNEIANIESWMLSICYEIIGTCTFSCSSHRQRIIEQLKNNKLYRDINTKMIWIVQSSRGFRNSDCVRGVYSPYFYSIHRHVELMRWVAGPDSRQHIDQVNEDEYDYLWQPFGLQWGVFVLPYQLPVHETNNESLQCVDMIGLVNGQMTDVTLGSQIRQANCRIIFSRSDWSSRLLSTKTIQYGDELVAPYAAQMVNVIKQKIRESNEHVRKEVKRRKEQRISDAKRERHVAEMSLYQRKHLDSQQLIHNLTQDIIDMRVVRKTRVSRINCWINDLNEEIKGIENELRQHGYVYDGDVWRCV